MQSDPVPSRGAARTASVAPAAPASPCVFASTTPVLFRHCDPAGIVFYPRYFEIINDFIDTWFTQGLGASFHTLHTQRGIGTPLASVRCDFVAPSRWNDLLEQRLTVTRIGGASVQVDVVFSGPAPAGAGGTDGTDGTDGADGADGAAAPVPSHGDRLRATLTIVFVDLASMKPVPVPDDIRAAMQCFQPLAPAASARPA